MLFSFKHKLLFSFNDYNIIRIFLYKENQGMYTDKYKSLCLNEKSIYNILKLHDCDEAILFFNGNNFDYFYHKDAYREPFFKSLKRMCTSIPAFLLFFAILIYVIIL